MRMIHWQMCTTVFLLRFYSWLTNGNVFNATHFNSNLNKRIYIQTNSELKCLGSVETLEHSLTWMTVFPPSRSAMANSMLSWKIRSLVAFMIRSMTRSDAPSLSRWHWTSAKLNSPRPPIPELTTVGHKIRA